MNMHDEQLLKAQRAVEEQRGWVQQIAKKRQWYHFMPECGWMNDPNGVIFIKESTIYFISFTPMGLTGAQCIGDMRLVMIFCTGHIYR